MVVETSTAVRRHGRPRQGKVGTQGYSCRRLGGLWQAAHRQASNSQPTVTQKVTTTDKNVSTPPFSAHLTARPPSKWQRMGHLCPLQSLHSRRWLHPLGRRTAPADAAGWTRPAWSRGPSRRFQPRLSPPDPSFPPRRSSALPLHKHAASSERPPGQRGAGREAICAEGRRHRALGGG